MAPLTPPTAHPPGWSPLVDLPPLSDPLWTATTDNVLVTVSPTGWASYLWALRDKIDLRHPSVATRLAALTAYSLFNAPFVAIDAVVHGRAVAASPPLPDDPVFVLGVPRSGTTLLQRLLAADERLFVTPDTFQVAHPTSFFTARSARERLVSGMLSERRPMDGVAQSFSSPMEDSLAVAVLCGGTSTYTALSLVAHYADFHSHYVTFETPAGSAAFPRWRDAFTGFLRRVLYNDQRSAAPGTPPRTLLLKSPDHTGRVRLLLRLFPRARFVYIHRHPLEIARSFGALVRRLLPQNSLAPWTAADGGGLSLDLCARLSDGYLADRALIPAGRLVEVAYDDLTADPAATLDRIYAGLALGGRDQGGRQAAAVADAVAYAAQGQRGSHEPLSAAAVGMVMDAWRPQFEAFGYTLDHPLAGGAGAGTGGGGERGKMPALAAPASAAAAVAASAAAAQPGRQRARVLP